MTAPNSGISASLERANASVGRGADAVSRARHVAVASWERRLVLGVLVAMAALLAAARHGLDHALRQLHPVGQPGAGPDALHGGSDAAAAAVDTWRQGADTLGAFVSVGSQDLPVLHSMVELALGGVLAVLAAMVLSWLREQADGGSRRDGNDLLAGYATALSWSLVALAPLVACWSVEQLLELRLAGSGDGQVPGTVAELARLSALAREALAVGVALPAVLTAVLLAARVWRPVAVAQATGAALSVAVLPAAAYLVIVTVAPAGVADLDGIRTWADRPAIAVAAIAAVAWLAIAARATATWLAPPPPGGHASPAALLGHPAPTERGGGPQPSGRLPASRRQRRATRRGSARFEASLAGAGVALMAVGAIAERATGRGAGLVALGAVVAVVGLAGLPLAAVLAGRPGRAARHDAPDVVAAAAHVHRALPQLLSLLPPLALGSAIVAAAVPEAVSQGGSRALLAWSLVPAVLGVALFAAWPPAPAPSERTGPHPGVAFGGLSGVALAALATATWLEPWGVADRSGPHALLATALTAATLALGGLGLALSWAPTPAAMQMFGFRRVPVLSVLVLWALVGGALQASVDRHEVRLFRTGADRAATLPIDAAFARWVAWQATPAGVPPTAPPHAPSPPGLGTGPGGRPAVPLVLVGASGGGARAAGFTAAVLDCTFLGRSGVTGCTPPGRSRWAGVFAASGASGGSVGLASVTAEHASGDGRSGWVRNRLGTDLVAPSVAWRLFSEAPDTLLHLGRGMDRAEVLERGWERRWGADDDPANPARAPLVGPPRTGWGGPLLFLNGTDRSSGCRVNISTVDGLPDTSRRTVVGDCHARRATDNRPGDLSSNRDLADYLCVDEDLALSTAAFLSARGGQVAPSATLGAPGDRRPGETACDGLPVGPAIEVGAGDESDPSAASTLLELWSRLAPLVAEHNRDAAVCVVPVFVEIDSGGAAAPSPAIEAVADIFRRPLAEVEVLSGTRRLDERYARFALQDHPGLQSADGWSLTTRAAADIERQVTTVPANLVALDIVGTWLAQDLRCEPQRPSSGGEGERRSGL